MNQTFHRASPPELREDDEIKAWMYQAKRTRPLAEVLSDSREVFRQLVETLDTISREELQNLRRILGLEEEQVSGSMVFAHFHQEHEPDMRAWLEKVKKAWYLIIFSRAKRSE